ncbi:hypothetical protein [Parahaliea aestuarii]|uniref:hypothetical protein n=1 Tax=Parahaliea aestuarii TaxID=1852021 RepID=UPI00164F2852|nr:hypothetical protein [Parahaliea aestuarii]
MEDMEQKVKELRILTGAGLLDCKKALIASEGSVQIALTKLRGEDDEPPEPEPEALD